MTQSQLRADAEALAQITMDLIDIPSPMGTEGAVAEYVADRLRASGIDTRLIDVEEGRPNVVGRVPGTGNGPTLLFVGHMDTTWGGDEEAVGHLGAGFQPKAWREDDWIYGMGAYNMKSGLATAIHAVELLSQLETPLQGDVLIAGVIGETSHAQVGNYQGARYRGAGVGARFLATNGVAADFAVIAEPTAGRIVSLTGGYLLLEVSVFGMPGATYKRGGAVAAVVKEAPDSIRDAMQIVDGIRVWGAEYEKRATMFGQAAGAASVIAIEGGHPWRPSKMSSFCRLYVEIVIVPGQDQITLEKEFRNLIRELGASVGAETSVQLIQNVAGAVTPSDNPFITELVKVHTEVQGVEPEITFDSFHADTSALTRFGIPSICYGPGGRVRTGGAGYYAREGEMCSISDLVVGADTFVAYAESITSRDRTELIPAPSSEFVSTVVR